MELKNSVEDFNTNGFVRIDNLVGEHELSLLRHIYDDFLNNKYDLTGKRGDLSGDTDSGKKVEKITQIMRPSLVLPSLQQTETYARVLQLARDWMGPDMEVDFDMMIDKAPGTNTITPWHQDAAYWPDMTDKRAVSFWIALDDASKENGCMMYVAGSHLQPMQNHFQPKPNAALQCELPASAEVTMGEIPAGSGIAHHGYTLHAALGNTSAHSHRRALIVNLRPGKMIEYMRSEGYDHLGTREVKNQQPEKG